MDYTPSAEPGFRGGLHGALDGAECQRGALLTHVVAFFNRTSDRPVNPRLQLPRRCAAACGGCSDRLDRSGELICRDAGGDIQSCDGRHEAAAPERQAADQVHAGDGVQDAQVLAGLGGQFAHHGLAVRLAFFADASQNAERDQAKEKGQGEQEIVTSQEDRGELNGSGGIDPLDGDLEAANAEEVHEYAAENGADAGAEAGGQGCAREIGG